MSKTLKDYFDVVVCCNLIERPDRRYFVEEQYRRLFGKVDFEFHTAVRHPLTDKFAEAFTRFYGGKYGRFSSGGELAYLFEHYTILKKAYYRGVQRLLIMEDDICFLKDSRAIIQFMENLPGNWDIIHGDYFSSEKGTEKFINTMMTTWVKHPGHGFWNTSFIGLSRRAIEYVLSIFEKYAAPADYPYWCAVLYPEVLNVYSASHPIVMQTDKNDSDIIKLKESLPNMLYSKSDRSKYFSFNEIVPQGLQRDAETFKQFPEVINKIVPLKQTL